MKRGADAGWGRDGDKGLVNPADPNTLVLFTSKPCLTAIAIAPKGPFAPDGPVLYAENWFTMDLRRWRLEGLQLDKLSPLPGDDGGPFVSQFKSVHTAFAPDGSLYMTQTYFGPSTGNDHKLSRIVATGSRPR